MTTILSDEVIERVYDYLCAYLDEWIQPPSEEIMHDLGISEDEAAQALARLQAADRVVLGTTLPKRSAQGQTIIL